MTKRTTFATRFLAMALALVLCVSNVMPGLALRASAEGPAQTAAELVAASYALSAEEAALLTSGYLKSEKYTLDPIGGKEDLVAVSGNTVTAKPYGEYAPISAELVIGTTRTPIALVDGVGTINTDALVYSVVVTYEQTKTVAADVQKALLNADEVLKGGMNTLKAGYDADTNLGVVVEALPVLKDLAAGTFGAFEITPAAGVAIEELNKEIAGNDGKLVLQTMNAAYEASASKLQYVMENGAAYTEQAAKTYGYLNDINTSNLLTNTNVDLTLEGMDELEGTTNAAKWGAFKGCLSALVGELDKVATADMDFLAADLLVENVNYAAVEALVNAITTSTPVEVVENLTVGYETVTVASDNAMNVLVAITMNYVEDGKNIAGVGEAKEIVVAKGATDEEIEAAVVESGIEAEIIAQLKARHPIAAELFDDYSVRAYAGMTDGIYTIVYEPVKHTVSYTYADAEKYPHGYVLTLPAHESASKAYDYTVNGVEMYQGETVTILGDVSIDRTIGKAYRQTDVYSVVGANSGNKIVQAILESGALIGNESIRVREPDVADAESLITLLDGVLTGKTYDASYKGLSWAPYSYGAEGNENLFSNGTGSWTAVEGKVIYRLTLNGYNAAEIIALAKTLKTDAEEQAAALNRLLGYENDMATLNKTQLGAVKGSLDYTDLTPGDNNDMDAKCVELRAYFHEIIGNMIANNITGTNLTIYGMVTEYKNGGLKYYYNNAEAVRNEVVALSDNLTSLCGDPEKEAALAVLLKEFGKPEYVEKITNLGAAMAEVKAGLSLPNAKIDLTSANLGKLITAVQMEGELETATVAAPYLESSKLTAKDESAVNVQIVVNVSGKDVDVASTNAITRGEVISSAEIAAVQQKAKAIFAEYTGENAAYYNLKVDGIDVNELADTALDKDVVVYFEYSPKTYTVKIADEANQTITVEDLEVNLPKHGTAGYAYIYTVNGKDIRVALNDISYNFTVSDLATLFANGSYEITRVENSEEKDKAEEAFKGLDAENKVYNAVIDPTAGGVMGFAMDIVNSGYTYIAFNEQPFMYLDANSQLEISMQVLIDAMLDDPAFGSSMLIKLGHGDLATALVNAKIDIGNSEDEVIFNDFDFTLCLSSVPSQLVTVANGLDAVKAYMSFESNPELDQLDVNLNLPEAVYEVYLTALLATSTLDKTDMNAMNHAIAFNFFDDYLEAVLADENITAQTYDNTINMLIKEFNEIADKNIAPIDVAKYDPYYQMVRDAVNGETVELIANEDDYTVTFSAMAEDVNEALDIVGIAVPSTYAAMVKELKEGSGNKIETKMVAYLADAYEDYEAAMIVLDTDGSKSEILNNVYDYTSDFAKTAAALDHEAAIILLDDVNSDITLSQSGVIDLNGKTINGNLTFTGRKLIIMDSSMNTVSGGGINGTISGDVVVLAGTYSADVSKFLRDGYYQENGAVKNALYYYENGGIVVDTDKLFDENYVEGYLPAVHYLATEIALDFALNYFTSASLTIEGNDIYTFNLDDIVGILGTDSNSGKVANLVDDLLAMIRFDGALPGGTGGIDEFINMLAADLLDIEGIYESVQNGTIVGDYKVTTGAWDIAVKHVADGDYVTAGLVTNTDLAKSTTLSLKFSGENKDKTLRYIEELARIIVEEETTLVVDLDQPYRDGNTLMVSGGATATLSLDFSHNCNYNRMLGLVLAYFNEDLTDDLVKNGCIMDLNRVIGETTVGDFFDTFQNVAEDVSIRDMIAKLKVVELSEARIQQIEDLYEKFLNTTAKVLKKLNLSGNTTPMSRWYVQDVPGGDVTGGYYYIDAGAESHSGDAYYRGYGVQADLKESFASIKIRFAPACSGLWGDVNCDGIVDSYDAALILRYDVNLINESGLHLCVADVSGEGVVDGVLMDPTMVDSYDAALVLRYDVMLIDKFPVE